MILGKWQWVFCLFGGSVPSLGQAVWRRDWKGGQWAKKITRISTTCLEPWVHQHPVCLFVFVCYIHIKNCVCVLCVENKKKKKTQLGWCSFNENMKPIKAKRWYIYAVWHSTLSRAECVCVDILAQSEAMTPLLYNPACGFAFGEGRGGGCPEARASSELHHVNTVTKTGNSDHMHL